MNGLAVRPMAAGEAAPLAEIYHLAVREGAASAYAPEQLRAWSPSVPKGSAWADRLTTAETLVAEIDGRIVGFMAWRPGDAWIDLAFVRPDAAGRGVATALYAVIEGRARAAGIARLATAASEIARPFFERHGWCVSAREEVGRDGVTLHRYRMEKALPARRPAAA